MSHVDGKVPPPAPRLTLSPIWRVPAQTQQIWLRVSLSSARGRLTQRTKHNKFWLHGFHRQRMHVMNDFAIKFDQMLLPKTHKATIKAFQLISCAFCFFTQIRFLYFRSTRTCRPISCLFMKKSNCQAKNVRVLLAWKPDKYVFVFLKQAKMIWLSPFPAFTDLRDAVFRSYSGVKNDIIMLSPDFNISSLRNSSN